MVQIAAGIGAGWYFESAASVRRSHHKNSSGRMSIFNDRQQQNFYLAMLGVVGLLVIAQVVWAAVRWVAG